ncbi:MAG: class B sortase [Clostridia bacterium]|nr:class B sortase [Clostridia bacterium]
MEKEPVKNTPEQRPIVRVVNAADKQKANTPQRKTGAPATRGAQQAYRSAAAAASENRRRKIAFWIIVAVTFLVLAVFGIYLLFFNKQQDTVSPNRNVVGNVEMYDPTSAMAQLTYNVPSNVQFPAGMQEKYKALYAADRHFVGWLSVPNTSMDTAVYQAGDNEYYLKKDLWGGYSRYGTVFLDAYDDPVNLSRNTVIYGHNFDDDKDGSYDDYIFGDVHKYLDVDFYRTAPVIEYNTLYRDYKWKVIGCFLTNGSSEGDNDYLFYYIATSMNNDNFMEYIDELNQRSHIHTTVDVQPDDKLLTLSTCTYFFDTNGALRDARCVLVARMVRDGESTDVDVAGATQNPNPRYPQLYYDVFGGSNPYRDAKKWYPAY